MHQLRGGRVLVSDDVQRRAGVCIMVRVHVGARVQPSHVWKQCNAAQIAELTTGPTRTLV